MHRGLHFLVALSVGCASATRRPGPDPLPEVRTVETAATAKITRGAGVPEAQSAYLGVYLAGEPDGRLVVADVAEGSPAAKAGVERGDLLEEFGGAGVGDVEEFRDRVQSAAPGERVTLAVDRGGRRLELAATLGAISRPMKLGERRAILGVQLGEAAESGGAPITRVSPGSAAEKAGLKSGDVVLKIDDNPVTTPTQLSDSIAEKKPGDRVRLLLQRGGKAEELKVELGADRTSDAGAGYFRGGSIWRKDLYRLAVVCVEYPDVKHNPKVTTRDWQESLFSRGTYVKKTGPTGSAVHGSLNDYYQEQSCGALRVEGKVFDWVEMGRKRSEYGAGTGTSEKTAFVAEALDKILARDGAEALKDFDGLFMLYAGDRVQTNRGGLYWPHRGSATHKGKRWPYFIVQEGGARMSSISVIAHEFGHLLGLPDLYARPENPGSEGLGAWCAMSNQNGNGRPQHFCAWCKEQLGWLKPAVIDPTVKQRLVLGPVEDSPRECFKVLVRPDGTEYLLLENRRKKGFDQDLPAEGLLIWRVVLRRPILEESHGIEGPSGPRVFLSAVPYPSAANDSFTPHTTPSSRSQLGGGLPVHVTQIRKHPDGRVSFSVGFEYD